MTAEDIKTTAVFKVSIGSSIKDLETAHKHMMSMFDTMRKKTDVFVKVESLEAFNI